MASPGGEDPLPPPLLTEMDSFQRLVAAGGKRSAPPLVPKFIKKLDEILEITLPKTQLVKIALDLSKIGLVG